MSDPVGGYGPTEDATPETQKICDKVKTEVEKKTGKNYKEFRPIKYRSQVVEGMNFLIKVHVGDYLHIIVYVNLPGDEFSLSGVQQHHAKDDPLEPF